MEPFRTLTPKASASSMLGSDASALCKKCETIDKSKFTPKNLTLCRDCKNYKNPKIYDCKNCGDKESENFIEGRFTCCKKCRNIKSTDIVKEKNLDEVKIDLEFRQKINKYVTNDKSIFVEHSLKTKIETLTSMIFTIQKQNEKLIEENSKLFSEINSIKKDLELKDNIMKYNKPS